MAFTGGHPASKAQALNCQAECEGREPRERIKCKLAVAAVGLAVTSGLPDCGHGQAAAGACVSRLPDPALVVRAVCLVEPLGADILPGLSVCRWNAGVLLLGTWLAASGLSYEHIGRQEGP